jgi:transcriptional regulator with XRE-family HTH domain
MDIFPARLKAARKAKRLTQRELATLAGMDQGHISRLESGGKGVSTEFLQNLAKILGVTIAHLLGEDAREDAARYELTHTKTTLVTGHDTPEGLRELSTDTSLVDALKLSEAEWAALKTIESPKKYHQGWLCAVTNHDSSNIPLNAQNPRCNLSYHLDRMCE